MTTPDEALTEWLALMRAFLDALDRQRAAIDAIASTSVADEWLALTVKAHDAMTATAAQLDALAAHDLASGPAHADQLRGCRRMMLDDAARIAHAAELARAMTKKSGSSN